MQMSGEPQLACSLQALSMAYCPCFEMSVSVIKINQRLTSTQVGQASVTVAIAEVSQSKPSGVQPNMQCKNTETRTKSS